MVASISRHQEYVYISDRKIRSMSLVDFSGGFSFSELGSENSTRLC